MKAINRFIRYCDFKGVKPSRFEKDFGISNGYFSVQLKRSGSLGEDTLKIIIDNCHDIDPEWLLTGKGNMMKNFENISMVSDIQEVYAKEDKIIAGLKSKIYYQDQIIDGLKRENKLLWKIVDGENGDNGDHGKKSIG